MPLCSTATALFLVSKGWEEAESSRIIHEARLYLVATFQASPKHKRGKSAVTPSLVDFGHSIPWRIVRSYRCIDWVVVMQVTKAVKTAAAVAIDRRMRAQVSQPA